MITKVTTDDLRKMRRREGLVFQGCAPPTSQWTDGINEILTREGILRGGSAFENVMEFENRGVTNLLFPLDGVNLDMERLALWRLENRATFNMMWLSDYADNFLGGFLDSARREMPEMSLTDGDGNIFSVMGRAANALRRAGQGDLVEEMSRQVMSSSNYDMALQAISRFVRTELTPDDFQPGQTGTEKKPSVRGQLHETKRAAGKQERPERTEPKRGGEPR